MQAEFCDACTLADWRSKSVHLVSGSNPQRSQFIRVYDKVDPNFRLHLGLPVEIRLVGVAPKLFLMTNYGFAFLSNISSSQESTNMKSFNMFM